MISVIMPVYNNMATVRAAAESVLMQETQLELICVDDGSSDGTAVILDELSAESPAVRVIHQGNAGPGAARNRGIDEARGEYITFADADDKLLPGALSALLDAMETAQDPDGCDLVIAGLLWRGTYAGGETREHDTLAALRRYEGERSMPGSFFELFGANLLNSMCAKLYRRDIIMENGVRVPTELDMGEDMQFNLRYLRHISTLRVIPVNAYLYENDNSTLTPRYRRELFDSRKLSVAMLREYLRSQGLDENICFFLYEKLLVSQTMQDIEHHTDRRVRVGHIADALASAEIEEAIDSFRPQGMMQRVVGLAVGSRSAGLITAFARASVLMRRYAGDRVNRVSI